MLPWGGILMLGFVRMKSPIEWSRVNACVPEPKVMQSIIADE
jgi:hypothetical protein